MHLWLGRWRSSATRCEESHDVIVATLLLLRIVLLSILLLRLLRRSFSLLAFFDEFIDQCSDAFPLTGIVEPDAMDLFDGVLEDEERVALLKLELSIHGLNHVVDAQPIEHYELIPWLHIALHHKQRPFNFFPIPSFVFVINVDGDMSSSIENRKHMRIIPLQDRQVLLHPHRIPNSILLLLL